MREIVQFREYEPKEVRLTDEEFHILKTDFSKKVGVFQIEKGRYQVIAKQYVGNLVLPKHVFVINP